jgi:hypothetical protein
MRLHWPRLFGGRSSGRPSPRTQRVRPCLEHLEDRLTPTVTPHGGALLPNVNVQGVYYGADWDSYPYDFFAVYLDQFLGNIVQSSYMDMLSNAGYGVGRGSATPGVVVSAYPGLFLSDSQIQTALEQQIWNGGVKRPDSNTLYVVFVEDNVVVQAFGTNSQTGFNGYHGAFQGFVPTSGWPGFALQDLHYAVIPYPGGWVGNGRTYSLSDFDSQTLAASHEIAEAVTDPNDGYKTKGWYDDSQSPGEVGDMCAGSTVYLNGRAVQRIVDQHDQPMTPVGATAQTPVTFLLTNGGYLYVGNPGSWTYVGYGISSISNQSIDWFGQAFIDVVKTNGDVYEYHVGRGWNYLWGGGISARADQAASYVLFGGGVLDEYHDVFNTWSYVNGSVSSFDAGTDRYGVNMVDMIFNGGSAWEYSDSGYWHYLGANVVSVSAGQNGFSDMIFSNGNAEWYSEAANAWSLIAYGAAQVTTGTDANGNFMINVLLQGGSAWEYRVGYGWTFLANGVSSMSKGIGGVVDLLFSNGLAYAYQGNGSNSLLYPFWVVGVS